MKAKEHNLDKHTFHLLRQTSQFFSEHNRQAYLTGGSIRNLLLGQPCSDWDIVTDGNAPELARSLADKLAGYYVHLNDKASRIVIKHAGSETTIDIAPLKGNTIEEDLRQRDFTVNAIAVPLADIVHLLQIGNVLEPCPPDRYSLAGTLSGGQVSREALIDPLNGLADIQARQLKAVDDTIFKQDPLRMLRAVRLSMRYQLSIEPATENLIKRDAKLLPSAAAERIHDELYAILEPDGATVQLRYLDALGLLTVLIPEFIVARGMRQPSPHHWDVLEHSLESVGALERLVAAIRQGYAGDHKGPHPTLPHPRPYGGDGGPNRGEDRPGGGKDQSDKGEGRPGGGDGGPDRGEDRPGGGKDQSDKGEGRPGGWDLLRGGFLSTETMETTETTETSETSVVPQGHPVWGTGYPFPRWDALPGGQVIPPHPPSHRLYGNDDPFPKNLPLRDGGEGRPDEGDGGPHGKGAEPNGDQADFAEIRTLLREAEQQGIFQFASLTASRMKLAALLHDIGKVGIPEAILNKSGPLDASEWETMKSHSDLGARLLEPLKTMGRIPAMIRHHHEFYDGSGYPRRLEGEQIPHGARVIAVADAYDTITSERTYKKARTPEDAFAELERCAANQFDPEIVRVFIETMRRAPRPTVEAGVSVAIRSGGDSR